MIGAFSISLRASPRPSLPRPCSLALLWLFDAAFVAVDASYAIVKYAVQAADHHKSLQADARGEVSLCCRPPHAG